MEERQRRYTVYGLSALSPGYQEIPSDVLPRSCVTAPGSLSLRRRTLRALGHSRSRSIIMLNPFFEGVNSRFLTIRG